MIRLSLSVRLSVHITNAEEYVEQVKMFQSVAEGEMVRLEWSIAAKADVVMGWLLQGAGLEQRAVDKGQLS